MKKDHLRDYTTHAFREYAAAGCPTYEQLRDKFIADAIASAGERLAVKNGIYKPTEAQIEAAERQIENAEGLLSDIVSVIKALKIIDDRYDGELIRRCLEEVYFTEPNREPYRGEISNRVRHVASTEHIDDSTVFRKLCVARRAFSTARKLNPGNAETDKLIKEILKSCE